jgi:molybdopterin converting factor small subunit
MAVLRLTGLLAEEIGARRLELSATTLGDLLRAMPRSRLVLDERGSLRALVHAYVDGERARDLGTAVESTTEVILVAAVAGG